ncbi:MAG: GNAT family N-acetyltransferase [Fimbriimonadales bacterium]
MIGLSFELARREHAKAIESMRRASADDLTLKLGPGHWSGSNRIRSIRERIDCADPEALRRTTLYVAGNEGEAVGSVAVSTFPPGFWKRSLWQEPKAVGLGVFNLVVFPEYQGMGIGRFLMEGVERLATVRNIPFVRLDAYTANPYSTDFYRHLGYDDRGSIEVRTVGLILFEKAISTAI